MLIQSWNFRLWFIFLPQFLSWIHTIYCWKTVSQVVMCIWIQYFIMIHVSIPMHAYKIYYYSYCLWIAFNKCHCFVDTIKHHREQLGTCIFNWIQFTHNSTNLIFLMHSHLYYITIIHWLIHSILHCQ